MKKYAVYVKNNALNEWEVMKLIVDPKRTHRGLAIYNKKDDAFFTEQIAHAISGGAIETRVAVYS